jgi:hypothetical protein
MILRVPTLVLAAVHAACGGSTCERKSNVCDLLCEEEEGGGASPAIEEMPKNQFQREANSLYLTLLGKRRGSLHGERVREE